MAGTVRPYIKKSVTLAPYDLNQAQIHRDFSSPSTGLNGLYGTVFLIVPPMPTLGAAPRIRPRPAQENLTASEQLPGPDGDSVALTATMTVTIAVAAPRVVGGEALPMFDRLLTPLIQLGLFVDFAAE